jgi:lysophospholipase L1-like esterase
MVALTFGGDPANIPPDIDAVIAGAGNPSLLVPSEIVAVRQATGAYNAFIETQANERGYAYVDPNELFEANESLIPAFPDLLNNPDQPFGPLFSLDGVHPSAAAHVAVTNALVEAINGAYDTSLQPVPTN